MAPRIRKAHLTAKEQKALQEFVSRVKTLTGKNLVSVRLFGSKARGDFRKYSDIDVLIVVHRSSWRLKNAIWDLAYDVNLEFDVYISPRVLPSRIFTARVWRFLPFIRNVRKESLPL